VRVRIGNHRVQLNVGDGAVIVREMRVNETNAALGIGHSVIIRVEGADAHCDRARDHGARITHEPVTYPYGERQYNADDFAGHSWTFSQSVADVHPDEWGGTVEHVTLRMSGYLPFKGKFWISRGETLAIGRTRVWRKQARLASPERSSGLNRVQGSSRREPDSPSKLVARSDRALQ
jgi:hypothetical protein